MNELIYLKIYRDVLSALLVTLNESGAEAITQNDLLSSLQSLNEVITAIEDDSKG